MNRGRGKTYRKGTRGISRRSPAPSSVETKALILDNGKDTTSTEGLGVCLALDLEDVEWEEDDFADTDQTASGRVHDGLARLLAECILKVLAVVRPEVVAGHRLATVLVDSLKDLVPGGIAKTREEGDELPPQGRAGLVLEDDRVELGEAGDLGLIAHQSLGNGVDLKLRKKKPQLAPCPLFH